MTLSTTPETVHDLPGLLSRLLDKGVCEPEVHEWEDVVRRSKDSFYAQFKAEKGTAAAEKALRSYVAERMYREVAACIKPIVVGVKELTEKTAFERYIKISHDPINSIWGGVDFPRHPSAVVVFNPEQPGCGCTAVDHTDVWGNYGSLRLLAVVITYNELYQRLAVNLVFPQRDNSHGITVIELGRIGQLRGTQFGIEINHRSSLLSYSLGLTTTDSLCSTSMTTGGKFDDRMGFPGAYDYLIKNLPNLGPYLGAVAQRANAHSH